MPLGPWRARHAAALAVLALAGCGGESEKAALGALAPATAQLELSERLSERVTAAVYADLPCVTAQSKEAAARRGAKQLPARVRERGEPGAAVIAQNVLDHATDLAQALARCVQEKAAEKVVDEVEAKIKTAATNLVDRLNDYFGARSSPIAQDVKSEVDDDGAAIDKAAAGS